MKKRLIIQWIIILGIISLAACSSTSGNNTDNSGDGETLFRKSVLGSVAGCATCHSTEPGTILIGPSLAGIGSAAGQRQEGFSAEEYLRQSIIQPDAYLVEGFPKSVMPAKYVTELSEDEVNRLVDYLLSLK